MARLIVYKKYFTITAVAWAVCLLPFVAAHMIVLKPQTDNKRHLAKKLTEKKLEYEAAQKAAEEQTKIELNEQIARLRERLSDFVIDFEDAADLKFDITQLAREKELAALSVGSGKREKASAKSPSDPNSISESPIDISFVSGFNQFASFVNSLERHRPVILVHEFKLARSNQNKSAYQITLDVRALVRKRQETEIAELSPAQLYSVKR